MGILYICVIVILQLDLVINTPNESREYCEPDTFEAECKSDEVVLMVSALYGRMSLGGCLTKYEEIGCFNDVKNYFDSMCSGRVRCAVKVHNLLEYDTRCEDKNLRNHLKANYTCVKVYQPNKQCFPGDRPAIPPVTPVYLSSYVTTKTACGTTETPWLLEVPKHHRITLTFYDFSRNTNTALLEENVNCRVLVIIKDIGGVNGDTSDPICGGMDRKRVVFRKIAQKVEIRFVSRHRDKEDVHFLVKYEVTGCPELSIRRGTEVIYTTDGAIIKCKGLKTWEIQCQNNEWIGKWSNCSWNGRSGTEEGIAADLRSTVMSLPYGTAVLLVVSIALAISGCVLLIGLCYVRRRRRQRLESTIGLSSQGRIPKHLNRLPPPYEDTSYTVPDVNNSYQHSWLQHQQQYRQAHVMSTNGHHNNRSSANPDSYQQRYVEHIYESPNFYRKEYESKSAPQSLQYYEVETTNIKS